MKRVINTYFGGKAASGTYQTIINHIRPHDCYIEGFLGGGTIMLAKKAAATNIGIELDYSVYKKWQKQARHLPNIQLVNGDCIDFLQQFDFTPFQRVVVYLDPPYPLSSRKDPRNRYKCELTDQQHQQLLSMAKSLPENVDVLLSSYPNRMYAEALNDWYYIKFLSQTRGGQATEILYMNYPVVDDLHDTSYAGQDYRERERIKKKRDRWLKNFKKMPMAERIAIFSALCQSNLIETNALAMDHTSIVDVTAAGPDPKHDPDDISPRQLILF